MSSSGKITAKTAGTTVVWAESNSNPTVSASCTVTVKAATVAVTGVTLNKTSSSLTVGDTLTLIATVSPSNATNKNVAWSSSNTNVATVSANGVVTAKSAGTATITVRTAEGNKTAYCTIIVENQSIVDGDVIFSISNSFGKPGNTVEVTLSVTSDVDVDGLLLDNLDYDKNVFEFVGLTNYGELVTTSLLGVEGLDSVKGEISLGYAEKIKPNGQICVIKFYVKDTANEGDYIIGINGLSSVNGQKVSSKVSAGKITISKWISGDFDDNEALNMKDVVYFMNWINFSWTGKYTMVYDGNKDFNKDGVIDMKDVVYFMNWVNFSWTGKYDINW
ncbi:MAG: Ig-like domain-containing protein [Clostridia bacterium]|nr:Ig-like domain-containing protein [Clostridia bacterium]